MEAKRHKADLELLKEQDPEFYQYLQQTDQELLTFGHSDSEPEDEDKVCIAKHAAPDLPVALPTIRPVNPACCSGRGGSAWIAWCHLRRPRRCRSRHYSRGCRCALSGLLCVLALFSCWASDVRDVLQANPRL